jgi:uncharacterized membrane protein
MASEPYPRWDEHYEVRHWIRVGIAVMLILIGISIFLAVAVPLYRGQVPAWSFNGAPWDWVFGLIGVVIAIWVVVWVVRLAVFGLWGPAYYRAYGRASYRHYRRWGPYGVDPAAEVARERFARGEITAEQLEEILRHLDPGPLPPK